MSQPDLQSTDKILLHVKAMYQEVSKQEMKVLKSTNEKKYTEYLINRFNELHNNYPALFNLLASDGENFNMVRLKEMLRLKNRINNNEISEKSASEFIGKKYFKEYASDKVNWSKER